MHPRVVLATIALGVAAAACSNGSDTVIATGAPGTEPSSTSNIDATTAPAATATVTAPETASVTVPDTATATSVPATHATSAAPIETGPIPGLIDFDPTRDLDIQERNMLAETNAVIVLPTHVPSGAIDQGVTLLNADTAGYSVVWGGNEWVISFDGIDARDPVSGWYEGWKEVVDGPYDIETKARGYRVSSEVLGDCTGLDPDDPENTYAFTQTGVIDFADPAGYFYQLVVSPPPLCSQGRYTLDQLIAMLDSLKLYTAADLTAA